MSMPSVEDLPRRIKRRHVIKWLNRSIQHNPLHVGREWAPWLFRRMGRKCLPQWEVIVILSKGRKHIKATFTL